MTASTRLAEVPRVALLTAPTPVEELARLSAALGGGARLLIKRDDVIPFGFGGNKIRKLESVLAAALAQGADTLVSCGGVSPTTPGRRPRRPRGWDWPATWW